MVLSAWCAGNYDFDIPCRRTCSRNTNVAVQTMNTSCVPSDEKSDTNLVKYQNNRTHALDDFCEYRAEQTLFTVTRFLCKNLDSSCFL